MSESSSNEETWDTKRATDLVTDILTEGEHREFHTSVAIGTRKLAELLHSVRADAVSWAWTEACSQHDKGLDPRLTKMEKLLERAMEDLNPKRS